MMLVALVGVLALAACGSNDSGSTQSPPPVATPQDFPKARGRTLVELQKAMGGPSAGPVLSPAVSQLEPGHNRFAFGLFDRARAQIADAPTAIYVAPATGGPAKGPYLARYESLAVEAPFRSQTVQMDKSAAKSVYVVDVPFRKPGAYEILGAARLDERLVAATPAGPPVQVTRRSLVPGVGQRAPRVHTPTKAEVAGDQSKIDTRVPPSSQQDVDLAAVLGEKPVILLFATPALCQSRVCGPVEDVAEQVKAKLGNRIAFVHSEIYKDNQIKPGCLPLKRPAEQCMRPPVVAYHLPTEPWLFAIDRKGRIVERIEGAFSAEELEHAAQRALR
jgi:hypothetical protein